MLEVMNRFSLTFLAVLVLGGLNLEAKQRYAGKLTFDVRDKRELITRSISKDLLLRVKRVRSARQEYFGWDVEVVRKPIEANSSNLLYHSKEWHGPYPSQVDAWQVATKYFPNQRELDVRGYPYEVKLILIDPVVEGAGESFVSGSIQILWRRKS
jgi:hypothetical protein